MKPGSWWIQHTYVPEKGESFFAQQLQHYKAIRGNIFVLLSSACLLRRHLYLRTLPVIVEEVLLLSLAGSGV